MNYSIEEVKKKKEVLKQTAINLKKKFVGIDGPIDSLVRSISVWYIMPELMTKPLVVCLWGMTGIGKTDLVRTMVRELKKSDSFVEIQLHNEENSSYEKVQRYLERTSVDETDQAILLLDEVQRFRTIDQKGAELNNSAYKDIWMLLSDGKFQSSSDRKMELMQILLDDLYYDDRDKLTEKDNKKENSKKEINITYRLAFWTASSLKRLLRSDESIEAIMKWGQKEKTDKITTALKSDSTFEGAKYSKLLIIISGNLDEAYSMSNDTDDADTDADIFHEFSKKINLIEIKNALRKRFKPEQIARFGNNHIIYPSLSKASYQEIIKRNIAEFINSIKKEYGITINPDDSIYETIYNNGVFPSQGVRPVLSTIAAVFENYLPNFIFEAIENNITELDIKFENDILKANTGTKQLEFKVQLVLDEIKKNKTKDEKVLVSIHEAGHAIAYALLFGRAPVQIKSSTSMTNADGFVGTHMKVSSKKYVKDTIAVTLAGQAAEELVFGDEFKSAGAASDIAHATYLGASYVRQFGFGSYQSKFLPSSFQDAQVANTEMEKTNGAIEILLNKGKVKARDLLNDNLQFFKNVAETLSQKGQLKPEDFIIIANKYGIKLINESAEVKIVHKYEAKWEDFKKSS